MTYTPTSRSDKKSIYIFCREKKGGIVNLGNDIITRVNLTNETKNKSIFPTP